MFEPLLAYIIVLLVSIARSSGEKSTLRVPALLERIEGTDKISLRNFIIYSFISRALVLLFYSIFIGIIVDSVLENRYEFLPLIAGVVSSVWGGYMIYEAKLQRKKFRSVLYSETGFKYMEPKYEVIAEYEGPIVGMFASFSRGVAEKSKLVMYWGVITGILSILNIGFFEFSFSVAYASTMIPNLYPILLAMLASLLYSLGAEIPIFYIVKGLGNANGLGGIEKRYPLFMKLNKVKFACSFGIIACGIMLSSLSII